MSNGWRKGFGEWWNKNRVEAHKVKNMGGFAAKIWKAALDHERAVAGATDSTSGFFPEDGGSIPPRQANTAPPQRKPLTDEEIDAITRDRWGTKLVGAMMQMHREYARDIEVKIKEKNT